MLPRHWAWLTAQRTSTSATLRRLVEAARKADVEEESLRLAVDAAHHFMWDIAGDLPDFEEATRLLFAHDLADFHRHVAHWPPAIRAQLKRFLDPAERALAANDTPPTE